MKCVVGGCPKPANLHLVVADEEEDIDWEGYGGSSFCSFEHMAAWANEAALHPERWT
jgi:hypothetical protein